MQSVDLSCWSIGNWGFCAVVAGCYVIIDEAAQNSNEIWVNHVNLDVLVFGVFIGFVYRN